MIVPALWSRVSLGLKKKKQRGVVARIGLLN